MFAFTFWKRTLPVWGVLLAAVLFSGFVPAYAFAPTEPAVPTPSPRPVMQSFDVRVFHDGEWDKLRKELICAHEYNAMLDGVLMFAPLFEYAEKAELPEIWLTEDFSYQVDVLDSDISVNCSHAVYNQDGTLLSESEMTVQEMLGLEPGKYLMKISVNASDEPRYASAACMLWLIVGA